jgi:transcriptional regulator with XRE-family HTH domain
MPRFMTRTLRSPQHRALVDFLVAKRKKAGLHQAVLAKKIRRTQSYIAMIETGQRRVDHVELMELAEALGFDASALLRKLAKVKR